jgi:hypothetical protein
MQQIVTNLRQRQRKRFQIQAVSRSHSHQFKQFSWAIRPTRVIYGSSPAQWKK